ncbi:MAG: magnesium-translocating P-type ATPase [Endomicrobium sp.]|jgi:Mg2+-importing ATPase|nr:magnesium-translocating P-type ATPase [Endomicrobium sp.]
MAISKKPLRNFSFLIYEAAQNKETLNRAAMLTKKALLSEYDNDFLGFDEENVEIMRDEYGKNEITRKNEDGVFTRLRDAFINPFTLVLSALAVISYVTDKDYGAVIIISVMIAISGFMRFIQEARSGKAAAKLSEMVCTTISVQRKETGKTELPIRELVIGDIVHLAAGDMAPADMRMLHTKDLFVSQSSLTGESEPVEKFSDEIKTEDIEKHSPFEFNNLVFMGSNVVSGSGIGIVVNIGDNTLFGSMSKQIVKKKVVTSFEKGVSSVSWLLIKFMMIMAPTVLLINGFTKGDWGQSLLFAISIAIGLTPEMLPMIVSANLAKGAVSMSKKKVIVKNLAAIQNLGAIDILCTDKTGTITQDKVVLEYYLNTDGDKDAKILQLAFLNSYYQTGLKNLMDIAVINHEIEDNMTFLKEDYHKVDEIPFDFNRRRMSVVVGDKDKKAQIITKGAIEEMLGVCTKAESKGRIVPLTEEIKKEILSIAQRYNEDGMRVLGLANKTGVADGGTFSVADESDMTFIGYLAFLDPPKESAEKAVKALFDYGIKVKILTGDNDAVTRFVCKKVGITIDSLLLGADIENMSDADLTEAVKNTNVFAKLSPQQKSRIINILRKSGHIVGFMGDGINDAPAMKEADVAISVDTAVDIAKESADIILLEKDLMVLENGVIEGRKTYGNTIKYIKMTASSNFGNMFSVLAASAFLPFLPMLPIQILVLNLIYDISCVTIPWDNVDNEFLRTPKDWKASSIGKFMVWLGPTSSIFDITTYLLMFYLICPAITGGSFHTLGAGQQLIFMSIFHTGWFIESLWSQTLVIHMIRTPKLPFIQSRASWQLTLLTTCGIAFGTVLPYTQAGKILEMTPLPLEYFMWLILTILAYMTLVTAAKKTFVRKYAELL